MARIEAPAADFAGTRHGVTFKKGVATTDDAAAIAYFRSKGYGIDGETPPARTPPEPADPRGVGFLGSGVEVVGTRLRDAAVDPRSTDFLPPSNAGISNPHGPEVISPELHGAQGVRPVTPGPVADAPPAQEAKETAHAVEMSDDVELVRPKANAGKPEWVEYAVAQGMDRDAAEASTRAALVDAYPPGDD